MFPVLGLSQQVICRFPGIWATYLTACVGVLSKLHAITADQSMKGDEHQVEAVHAAFKGVPVVMRLGHAWRGRILRCQKVH